MKTKEELNALKEEYESMKDSLAQLSEDELKQVTGGHGISVSNPLAGMSEEEAKRIAQQLALHPNFDTIHEIEKMHPQRVHTGAFGRKWLWNCQ